jgi:UMF1 family MFS transporter
VFFILGLGFLLTLRGKKLRDEPTNPNTTPPPPASSVASTPLAAR